MEAGSLSGFVWGKGEKKGQASNLRGKSAAPRDRERERREGTSPRPGRLRWNRKARMESEPKETSPAVTEGPAGPSYNKQR